MARWVGTQGQVYSATKAKTCPIMMSPKENLKPKTKKNFFSLN